MSELPRGGGRNRAHRYMNAARSKPNREAVIPHHHRFDSFIVREHRHNNAARRCRIARRSNLRWAVRHERLGLRRRAIKDPEFDSALRRFSAIGRPIIPAPMYPTSISMPLSSKSDAVGRNRRCFEACKRTSRLLKVPLLFPHTNRVSVAHVQPRPDERTLIAHGLEGFAWGSFSTGNSSRERLLRPGANQSFVGSEDWGFRSPPHPAENLTNPKFIWLLCTLSIYF
jgi:hypothetical protein